MSRTFRFDPNCQSCPRLSRFLDQVKQRNPDYHCKPVAPFGDPDASLLIVGLAPGMHGANATGRPFTGDFAGILLYQTLHRFGFSNQPESTARDDGLTLKNCRITNAVKCLPPDNKPSGDEIKLCNEYLADELRDLPSGAIVLALGTIAHNAVLRACGMRLSAHRFGHGSQHDLNADLRLIDSYHCNRYNTQTKRLTESMLHDIFRQIQPMAGHDIA